MGSTVLANEERAKNKMIICKVQKIEMTAETLSSIANARAIGKHASYVSNYT